MLFTDRDRARLDALLRQGGEGLTTAPRRSLDAGRPGQTYQVALSRFEKAAVLGGMRASGADKRFDRTIRGLTDGQFNDAEIAALKDRALTAAEWGDVGALSGIEEGPPITVRPGQKAVLDSLMGRLGSDALSQRAQDAYGRASRSGKIRVR